MSNEVLFKIIKERRSIRNFKSKEVEIEKIEKLVESARWAPSGGNSQPWRFVIITDRNALSALKAITPGWLRVEVPPALILICADKKRVTNINYMDIGAAMQNILLYAHSLSLGCCAIASFDFDSTATLLGLPEHIRPVLFIAVGYPDEEPTSDRLSLNELIVKRFMK